MHSVPRSLTAGEYRRFPTEQLERWMTVVATAGEHAEAEVIRREISTPAEREEAA